MTLSQLYFINIKNVSKECTSKISRVYHLPVPLKISKPLLYNLKRTHMKITKGGENAQLHCSMQQQSIALQHATTVNCTAACNNSQFPSPFKAGEIFRALIISRMPSLVRIENKVWFFTDTVFRTQISV